MLTGILTAMEPPWTQSNIDRFAGLVRARLTQLGRSQDLTDFGGPSDTTVRKLLRGDVGTTGRIRSTLYKLDQALNWERGSSERVLDGGEPVELAAQTDLPSRPPMSAAETADLEAGVQKLISVHAGLIQRGQWDLAASLGSVIQAATQVGQELSRLNATST